MDRCLSLLGLLALAAGVALVVANLPVKETATPEPELEPMPQPASLLRLAVCPFHAAFSLN